MRTLCLNLQKVQEPSCAEVFLKFSPRVQFRYPQYVFLDIESTASLFGGEFSVLKQSIDLARQFSTQATGAIADHPAVAQILSNYRPFELIKPGEDFQTLRHLSVAVLPELEGLYPWTKPRQIEHIVQFFQSLGFHTIDDIQHFQLTSFRERWGETGIALWRRLHGKDTQVISPLTPQDPFQGYGYFDDPVYHIPVLMQKIDPQMTYLFLRLEGLNRFAQKMEIILHCEYSQQKHSLFVEPVSPSRDLRLYRDLLLRKLDHLGLENPIREFDISVYDVPEKIEQLDFFEPRDLTEDRWRRLISFAKQSGCEMGFLQMKPAHLPEDSFEIQTEWPQEFNPKDLVKIEDDSIQVKSVYAKALAKSPRPSLLLKEPLQLSRLAIQKLQMLTRFPAERIESAWWNLLKKKEDSAQFENRDYYYALSSEGQMLWVYLDRLKKEYYLHGYFD
ncbi:MAG: hypothetical protein ACK5UJ_05390 [Pseudobdellovibrionaceae bacterium]